MGAAAAEKTAVADILACDILWLNKPHAEASPRSDRNYRSMIAGAWMLQKREFTKLLPPPETGAATLFGKEANCSVRLP